MTEITNVRKMKEIREVPKAEITLPSGRIIRSTIFPDEDAYLKHKETVESVKSFIEKRGMWWQLHKFYWINKKGD